MERRLGKGLSSLLGGRVDGTTSQDLPLSQIDPNPFQPRVTMDPAGLEELRDSIGNHGVLQPIVVRKIDGRYQIISGERRWRAARLAGLERIPAVLREVVSDNEMLELALVENVQRRDLDPLERARGFKALMEGLGITQEAVAIKVGLKRATVANHMRLLELPDKVQQAVGKGLLSMGHARALLGLSTAEQIEGLMEQCVRKDLSVRDVERLVRDQVQRSAGAETGVVVEPTSPWIAQIERRLGDALATKVTISADKDCVGQIRVQFFDKDQLNRLIERLAPQAQLR
ncbi:MAG: ParB/RepB/Spo0J family partition protein [Planctomycetes bacterium]|nr:ParB/RepB/Spo0J family partition protein [Planctomycetota bacterium]